jgi:lipopolysaccharide assembly outer membrane protein LptD (OstA)
MLEFLEKYKNYLLALVGLFMLFFVYIAFMRVDHFLKDIPPREKKVELKNIQLEGFNEGKLAWTVKAQSAWSSYTIDYSNIENIFDGVLYDRNGTVLIRKLQAQSIRVNAPQERLNARGKVSALILRQGRPIKAAGEQLQYVAQDKKTYLYDQANIVDGELVISANNIQIDHETKKALFTGNPELYKPGILIRGSTLLIDLDNESGLVKGGVSLKRKADPQSNDSFRKKDTDITCNELSFKEISGNAEITCQGDLKIRQEDKQGIAEKGSFSEKNETLFLYDKVYLIFDRSDWLLDTSTVNKLKQKELKTALYEKLIILADQVELSTRSKDFTAQGHVAVTLKEKDAVSEQAVYKEKDKKIFMTGHVRLKKADGSWINAQKVVVDIDKEVFLAEGQVQSTVILKR